MKKIKGLLYCTKEKPYIMKYKDGKYKEMASFYNKQELLNGKIVAECDFEVDEHKETNIDWLCMSLREKIIFGNMCEKANIDELKCYEYANGKPLYALHISNLKIFDKPYKLGEALIYNWESQIIVEIAPQNMCRVYNRGGEGLVLISVQPQELCRILNGEQTILIKKQVLNCMKDND